MLVRRQPTLSKYYVKHFEMCFDLLFLSDRNSFRVFLLLIYCKPFREITLKTFILNMQEFCKWKLLDVWMRMSCSTLSFFLFFCLLQRVHLDIQVGEHANNYAEIAAKDKLTELQLRVRQLVEQVDQIQKEQNYQRVSQILQSVCRFGSSCS